MDSFETDPRRLPTKTSLLPDFLSLAHPDHFECSCMMFLKLPRCMARSGQTPVRKLRPQSVYLPRRSNAEIGHRLWWHAHTSDRQSQLPYVEGKRAPAAPQNLTFAKISAGYLRERLSGGLLVPEIGSGNFQPESPTLRTGQTRVYVVPAAPDEAVVPL